MSLHNRHPSRERPVDLATRITQQTPYSLDQALRGVYGLMSCYGDCAELNKAVEEFIQCQSGDG